MLEIEREPVLFAKEGLVLAEVLLLRENGKLSAGPFVVLCGGVRWTL